MRSCGECAAAALERVQIKRAIAAAGKRYEPSAEFRAQVLQGVAAKIPTFQKRDVSHPAGRGWLVAGSLDVPAFSLVVIVSLLVNFYVGA